MPVDGVVTRKDHSSNSSDFRCPSTYSSYPKGSSQGFADKSSTLGSQLHVDLQSKDGDPIMETQSVLQKNGLPIHQISLSPSALTIHVDASDTGWGVHSQVVSKAGCWTEREKQESINVRELKQTQPEQRREDIIVIDSSDDEQNQSAPTTTVNNTVINNDSSDSGEESIDDFDIVDSDTAGLPPSSFWSRTITVRMKNIHDMYQICCTKAAATRYLRNEGAFYAADTPLFCGGGSRMHFVDSSNRWRCNGIVQQNGRQCCSGTSRAATLDSFFYHRHIACNNVLLILYFWAIKTPRMTISQAVGIHQQYTSGVINDWHQMIYCDLSENDTKIGGPGIIVEIDESKFGKRKYHRGHRVEGVWVVGGIERTDERKCFLITVQDRTALTLEAIIREHVLPGSIVYTDCWRAYSRIPHIVSDSQHRTVNHSREYITVDGVHTNTIEGTWAGVKCNIAVRLRNRKMMPWMLVEFIWRRKHYGDIWGGIMKCMSEVEFHRHDDFTPYLTEFRNDADSEEDE